VNFSSRTKVTTLGSLVALLVAAAARAAAPTAAPSGDEILARAAAANAGLHSYSVPVHFDVHLHKPLGLKVGVDGTAYYKAPASSAVVITKAPPIIGGFFKGTYPLDIVPQSWSAKYHVTSVSTQEVNGTPVYLLEAVPKDQGAIDRVVFGVAQTTYAPLSARWHYRDQSTVGLTIDNQSVAGYTLPLSESISVAMPHYDFDAASRFGQYALNAPVPDDVFARH
jgi:outer membrane lipoprotein-sorting protein